jgi:hypothetical protein
MVDGVSSSRLVDGKAELNVLAAVPPPENPQECFKDQSRV